MKIPASSFRLSKSGLYLIAKETTVADGFATQTKMCVSKEDEPEAFKLILDAQKS